MAIEEVLQTISISTNGSLTGLQEFSIEIPDKEADRIQSSMFQLSRCMNAVAYKPAVDKAIEYILSQPDGRFRLLLGRDSS